MRQFRARLNRYAEDARSTDPNQGKMFGTEDIKPAEAFERAFAPVSPRPSLESKAGLPEGPTSLPERKDYLDIGHNGGKDTDLWWMQGGRIRRVEAEQNPQSRDAVRRDARRISRRDQQPG